MELTAIAIGGLALFSYLIYGFWEISALKYGLLRAMATQSDAVDRALRELLREKVHDKLDGLVKIRRPICRFANIFSADFADRRQYSPEPLVIAL